MDRITGMAAGFWAKQKLGGIGIGSKTDAETKAEEKANQNHARLQAQRAEREKDYQRKQADRAEKKESIAAKWAANKDKHGKKQ